MTEQALSEEQWEALAEQARRRYRRGMRVMYRVTGSALGLGVAALGLGALAFPETPMPAAGAITAVGAVLARQLGGIVVQRVLEARARAWLGEQVAIAQGRGAPPESPAAR